jgi:Glutathione S-transferase, N-terminal domain
MASSESPTQRRRIVTGHRGGKSRRAERHATGDIRLQNHTGVDLGAGEQHSEAYRAINPRRVVPTLVLGDGTTIGEVPAIMRYLDEPFSNAERSACRPT